MNLTEIMSNDEQYFLNAFGKRTPVCFERGEGMQLFDKDGKTYTDLLGGLAVTAFGHSHPRIVEAIKEQAGKLLHCSNLYYIESQAKLAELLCQNTCADKVFFGNSGAEANEGALKLARLYYYKKGIADKYQVITMENSFHGRTLATLAATGQEKYRKPYRPLMPEFISVPLNDIAALEAAITPKTCAIMLEPIQGESGVHEANAQYLKAVRTLCDEKDIILIFDEIQCGMGRTGTFLASEQYGVEPDIFTLAKALAAGIPIGAVCVKDKVAKFLAPGEHGSTFGGNPFACAVGVAAVNTLIDEKLMKNAADMGTYFVEKLMGLKAQGLPVSEVRGKGLMIGVGLSNGKAAAVKDHLFTQGYLIGNVGADTLRLLPPLIITKKDIDTFIVALTDTLTKID